RGAVDHLEHDDRLILNSIFSISDNDTTPPQGAIVLVVIEALEALGAAIAYEGGGTVDSLAVAIAFDHRTHHLDVGLLLDISDRDQIGCSDHQRRHHHAMPEVQLQDVALDRRIRIVMDAPRAGLAMYGGLRHPVKRIVGPVEEPAAADESLEEGPQARLNGWLSPLNRIE